MIFLIYFFLRIKALYNGTTQTTMVGFIVPWLYGTKYSRMNQVKFFILALLCGVSKGYMKISKAFTKPFEAPQRSVKIKI